MTCDQWMHARFFMEHYWPSQQDTVMFIMVTQRHNKLLMQFLNLKSRVGDPYYPSPPSMLSISFVLPPFLSLFFLPLLFFYFFLLRSRPPLIQLEGLGVRGYGMESQLKSNLVHFSFDIWYLVATVLLIFLRLPLLAIK